jgi:cytochrome c
MRRPESKRTGLLLASVAAVLTLLVYALSSTGRTAPTIGVTGAKAMSRTTHPIPGSNSSGIRSSVETVVAILVACAATMMVVMLVARGTGETRRLHDEAIVLTMGDPDRGRDSISRVGCGACHVIPGVPGARGMIGPPLSHMGQRLFIAGVRPNTAENLIAWIRSPQSMLPGNGMPDLGLSDREARDIAAYLLTLQ